MTTNALLLTRLLLALLCGLPAASCGEAVPDAAPRPSGLVIQNPTAGRDYFHEFGNVPWGSVPRHAFLLKNCDSAPVAITDIQTVCYCTQPTAVVVAADGTRGTPSKDGKGLVVPPGASLEVAVAIDTKLVEKPNVDKLALVRLRCDSAATPYISFELHCVVKKTFRAVPQEAELGRIGTASGKAARVDCSVEVKGDPSRLVRIERVDGPFEAALQETTIAGETVWIVSVTAPPGLPLGPVRGKVVLAASAPEGRDQPAPFEVPVSGSVVDDLLALPPNIAFGTPAAGVATTVVVDLVASMPNDRFRVVRHAVEGFDEGEIAVLWQPQGADDEGRAPAWRAQVQATAARKGPRSGGILVETDHPLQRTVKIGLSINAQ